MTFSQCRKSDLQGQLKIAHKLINMIQEHERKHENSYLVVENMTTEFDGFCTAQLSDDITAITATEDGREITTNVVSTMLYPL